MDADGRPERKKVKIMQLLYLAREKAVLVTSCVSHFCVWSQLRAVGGSRLFVLCEMGFHVCCFCLGALGSEAREWTHPNNILARLGIFPTTAKCVYV